MDCRTFLLGAAVTLAACTGCITTSSSSVPRMSEKPATSQPFLPTPPPATPPSLTAVNAKVTPSPSLHQTKSPAERTKSKINILMAEAKLRMGQARDEKNELEQTNKYDEARKVYQEVLKLDDKFLPAFQGLAQTYLKMDKKDQALETIQQALRLAPRDPNLLYDQAHCYLCRREWREAQNSLFNALQADPENRQIKKMLGFTLARAGQFEQALEFLSQYYSVPGYAHFMLARVLAWPLQGQEEKCKEQLRLALRDNPNLEEARHMLNDMEHPAGSAPVTQLHPPVEEITRVSGTAPQDGEIVFSMSPNR